MKVDLKEGSAVLLPEATRSFDPRQIARAVERAGFSPGPVDLVAIGTLERTGDVLRLTMPSPFPVAILNEGEGLSELGSRTDLLGGRVRVTGRLGEPAEDGSTRIVLDRWEPASDQGAPGPSTPGAY